MQAEMFSHWIGPELERCGPILAADTSVGVAIALLQSHPEGCLWVGHGQQDIQASAIQVSQIKGYVTASQLLSVIATPAQVNPLERSLGDIAQPSPVLSIQIAAPRPDLEAVSQALADNGAFRFLVVDEQQQILGQLSREALQRILIDQLRQEQAGAVQITASPVEPASNLDSAQASVVQATVKSAVQPAVQPALRVALEQLNQALNALEAHDEAESRLQHRIAFETLLTQISTQFLNLQEVNIDQALHEALAHTATFTHCDRACIFLYNEDGSEAHCRHEWNRDNLIPFTKPLCSILRHMFPWSLSQMQQQQPIHVPDISALPPEAAPEREAAEQLQAQSYVVLPIHFQGKPLGWLAFYAVHDLKTWAPADLQQLETLSSIIAGVIARQQAEAALAESEAKFAQLAENLDQVFFIYQADPYELVYISPAYERIWGLPSAELYQQPGHWRSTIHPDDYERVITEMERRRSEGISVDLEYRILHPSGEERWIRSRSFPLRDDEGRIYRLAGIAEDVSDRHRYEAALARSEEKFSKAFRFNPMPMCITVLGEGRYVEVNDAFCQHSGFSREELIGQTIWDLDMIVDPAQCDAIRDALLKQGSFQNMELHSRDRQGRTRITQSSGLRIDVNGQERILSISRDITEQRQQEAQRQQIEQALRQASQAAEAASQAKSELLAMVSHEIRTPLSAILSMSELLLGEGLSTQQQDQIAVLRSGGEQLLAILDEVLEFSQLNGRRIQLNIAPFDLEACIRQVRELFAAQAQAKGLNLRLELSPQLNPSMVSDSKRLKQLLNNLVNNAIKFSSAGQITLAVQPGEADRDNLLFSVRDQGIGIDQAGLDRLFEPFSQANASIAKRYGGSGLGLNICDRIVRCLGGQIWVESGGNLGGNPPEGWAMRQGKSASADPPQDSAEDSSFPGSQSSSSQSLGSHFYFTLPRVYSADTAADTVADTSDPLSSANTAIQSGASPRAIAAPRSAIASPPSATAPAADLEAAQSLPPSSVKILLVEDSQLNQQVAQLFFQRLGYGIDLAVDGPAAIAALGQRSYDLIFLDLNLPGLNGYEVYEQIQAFPQHPWVIAMSAAVDSASREHCRSLGMNDFVPKPISQDNLTMALGRFWTEQRSSVSSTRAGFPLPTSQAPSLRLDLFRKVQQLCGSAKTFEELLLTYQEDAALQLQAIAQAQVVQDGAALFDVLHSLGPATASLGGARLAELCNHLETQLREHGFYRLDLGEQSQALPLDWSAIAAQLQNIEAEYQRFVAAMDFQTWDTELLPQPTESESVSFDAG